MRIAAWRTKIWLDFPCLKNLRYIPIVPVVRNSFWRRQGHLLMVFGCTQDWCSQMTLKSFIRIYLAASERLCVNGCRSGLSNSACSRYYASCINFSSPCPWCEYSPYTCLTCRVPHANQYMWSGEAACFCNLWIPISFGDSPMTIRSCLCHSICMISPTILKFDSNSSSDEQWFVVKRGCCSSL